MLKKAAAFLNDGVQVELTKPNLTNWIIARIENFLPETCKMCDKQYCITFGQKPALACFICGQGIHEACYLKKINNHIIPDILGLHWLCSYCSPRATITNEPRTLPQTGRSKQTLIGETDMANKSCHTQAIQVPLVNDKNEDNDMQTPTKQETGDPAEKDQTSHEKKQIQSKRSNEGRPVCIHYRRNKCKHGLSGTGCMYSHPKPCRPYINFGTDRKKGCQNGRECELLHPKMCRNSLRKKECFGKNCKFMHRKGTIRIKTTEPTPPGPSSAGYENHFPKMRKPGHGSAGYENHFPKMRNPGHGSTVNENHATQLHTSAVTNPNSQKFDIVMNESSFLGIIYQLQQQLYSIQTTQQNQATLIQRLTPGLTGHVQQIQTAQQTEYPVSTVPATTTVLPTIGQMYPVQQA
ncbi:KAG0712776.1hypothetical protein GWK47_017709 [Octopus vulgaris]|uniref:C3H1-type domain-containing protein n=1 Tax=Octopus vulgaris TaxID=6645 RepID=A0AA36AHK5_OCTVU|nr:KAG0712776.1hypothetical protein GWK47_017709 [Octopus vulgaris]